MNELQGFVDLLKRTPPFSGVVPAGHTVDFLGTLTSTRFSGDAHFSPETRSERRVATAVPTVTDGEVWFEAVDWFEAAREARGRFVMVTLGAWYGAQAVGSYRALQRLNPLPCKLVAVEPEPDKFAQLGQHMRTNGIDPADHWLVRAAISDSNDPVLFPLGAPATGRHNCIATNEAEERARYVNEIIASGQLEPALRDLLLRNSTGLRRNLREGGEFVAEIGFVSAVTLADILGPFDRVDLLEADIQQSEVLVFPFFMPHLQRKVRRVHIGTHGDAAHDLLLDLFTRNGWTIVFNYGPDRLHETAFGAFRTSDGILTAVNPGL